LALANSLTGLKRAERWQGAEGEGVADVREEEECESAGGAGAYMCAECMDVDAVWLDGVGTQYKGAEGENVVGEGAEGAGTEGDGAAGDGADGEGLEGEGLREGDLTGIIEGIMVGESCCSGGDAGDGGEARDGGDAGEGSGGLSKCISVVSDVSSGHGRGTSRRGTGEVWLLMAISHCTVSCCRMSLSKPSFRGVSDSTVSPPSSAAFLAATSRSSSVRLS